MLRLLLDTHAFLWHADSSPRLSAGAVQLIDTPGAIRFISRVSLFEIVIKHSIGKLPLPQGFAALVRRAEKLDLQILEITDAHLSTYLGLPLLPDHRDPFDRLLVAQAQAEKLELVSRDPNLRRYGVPVRW